MTAAVMLSIVGAQGCTRLRVLTLAFNSKIEFRLPWLSLQGNLKPRVGWYFDGGGSIL